MDRSENDGGDDPRDKDQGHSQNSNRQGVSNHIGVLQVYPAIGDDIETDVDIFAIHGLDTTSPDTWTFQRKHEARPTEKNNQSGLSGRLFERRPTRVREKSDRRKNGVNWLTSPDMLSYDLPRARIFTCNWPSRLYRDQGSVELTVLELARGLLADIQSERRRLGAITRPIIFIASCLGGIILAQALTLAAESENEYYGLSTATAGVVFLGTPFRGTALAHVFGTAILSLEARGVVKSQSLARGLLDHLGKSTAQLEELVNRFSINCCLSRNLPVYCFYETIESHFVAKSFPKWTPKWLKAHMTNPKVIVDSSSARLDVAKESIALHVTHVMMNKFPDREDSSYRRVRGTIQSMIEQAMSVRSQTLVFTGDDARSWNLLTERIPSPGHEMEVIEDRKERLISACSEWILKLIDWQQGPDASVIHFVGGPGTGKTMAMINLIRYHLTNTDQQALSYFFFEGKSKDECAFYRGLIYHLLRNIRNSNLISHLTQELASGSDSALDDAIALRSALQRMLADAKPSLLFVDGIDECEDKHHLKNILRFIRETTTELGIKWVVSSRSDPIISESLQSLGKKCLINSIELSTVLPEISIDEYIRRKVELLAETKDYSADLRHKIHYILKDRSAGIFLWVSLVCEMLQNDHESWDDRETLHLLEKLPTGLPDIYSHSLSKLRELERRWSDCVTVLATAATTLRPLHLEELASIAFSDRKLQRAQAERCVRLCSNFLVLQADIVHFIHQSARDFLKDDPMGDIFDRGISDRHSLTLSASMRAMKDLKENIYELEHCSTEITEIITPRSGDPLLAMSYSCESWIDHLIASFSDLEQHAIRPEILCDQGEIHEFMSHYLLCWLEALCLKRVLHKGLDGVRRLEAFINQWEPGNLSSLLKDTTRFILRHMSMIDSMPLQIYRSALLFSPKNSIIRRLFLRKHCPIKVILGLEPNWDHHLQTFQPYMSYGISHIALSNCGKTLASGDRHGAVQVWNMATGRAEFAHPCDPWEVDTMQHLAFSPDGGKLAILSGEHIRLWIPATNQFAWITPCSTRHGGIIVWPNKEKLLVVANYGTMLLLDAATGQAVRLPKLAHFKISCSSFWPQGNQLMLGSTTGRVQLLDATTGQIQQSFENKDKLIPIQFLAKSADGRKLITIQHEKEGRGDVGHIVLWCAADGGVERTWEVSDLRSPDSLVFWPDASKFAFSPRWSGDIWIWDIVTGGVLRVFYGHTLAILSLVLSPDKQQLISGSIDGAIEIWDVATIETEKPNLGRQTLRITSVAFSPDGKYLAAVLVSGMIHLHEVASGNLVQRIPPQEYAGRIQVSRQFIEFSPDGLKLASWCGGELIEVLNLTEGRVEQFLTGITTDSGDFRRILMAFSSDGTKLATYAYNCKIQIWDVARGSLLAEKQFNIIYSLAFSPDGERVAFEQEPWKRFASHDFDRISLWNMATNRMEPVLDQHEMGHIESLAFSADGRKLATSTSDRTIHMWEMESEVDLETVWLPATPTNDFGHMKTYSLDPLKRWIYRNGSKFLSIPSEYALSSTEAITNDAIAFGTEKGQLMILHMP
ncbi:hypothetical protein PFICI_04301 [Pestalotiopsis fici W106-1]|uniref:NACHT domain-containing protein n=1 Tax=Pestalotiopsis fici (strain W106-1 / CGMCC3.15140) TaxID=1229662 RepID=W3X8Q5_PESFW|nr:uncharacterized protein PFICI_04301 [Pestalotiopsis fici W106-1]ETS82425.1 hypothetical protein PFICI_04301 [Pestalotiopsis fici W106-1]